VNAYNDVYRQAARTRAAIRGFINYLRKYEKRKATQNLEPLNLEPLTSGNMGTVDISTPVLINQRISNIFG